MSILHQLCSAVTSLWSETTATTQLETTPEVPVASRPKLVLGKGLASGQRASLGPKWGDAPKMPVTGGPLPGERLNTLFVGLQNSFADLN